MNTRMPADASIHPTRFWHALPDGRVQCDLCPRGCRLRPGQRGFCFVRANHEGEIVLTTYGRSSGFCIDPIEKKPLNHFFPGTPVLSFGTAGCNLACRFCQNWDISKSRSMDTLGSKASPETIARTAAAYGCTAVAFTYNDPVIFHEYARDVAAACHDRGIRTIAVTANYLTEQARCEFYSAIDAANVDLKAFSDDFYRLLTGARLQPVLENLEWLVHDTNVWVEITTLLIPGYNDSDRELHELCEWIGEHLNFEIPVHFTAFHPDYKMLNVPHTPLATLRRARFIAMETGLHYAYTGNAYDPDGQTTWCPGCGAVLVGRSGYTITQWNLDTVGRCQHCRRRLAGHFQPAPGDWGARCLPVRLEGP